MCGDTTADHKMSVEDIIAEIVQASTTSMQTEVDGEKSEKLVRFDDVAAEPKKSTKHMMVRKVKMAVRPMESEKALSTVHEVEEDDIDETAHMFELKEDGWKPRKIVKGGHLQKEDRGSTLRDSTPEMKKSRAHHATRNICTQGKQKASADVESKEEIGDEDKVYALVKDTCHHRQKKQNRPMLPGLRKEREKAEPLSSQMSRYGCPSDESSNDAAHGTPEIFDSNGGTEPILGVSESTPMPVRELILSESQTMTQMDTESSQNQSNTSIVAVNEVGHQDNTTEDLIGFPDDNLPSTLDDWDNWHNVAFRKGNLTIQLAKVPMEKDSDGLLIPDHPANYQMDFDADFHEALGMTWLYSALTHIDTHPEFLTHIFDEIGKASAEERLGNSHPGFRLLPELPVPVKSMVSIKHWPFSDILELDAEGDRNDKEDVSGALSDMLISEDTVQRAFPAKDGGRGSSKRPNNTLGSLFIHHSSLTPTSIGGIIRQPGLFDSIEAASSSIPSDSCLTRDCGMDTTRDPVHPPQSTQAIQHHDNIGDRSDIDSNMHISSPSNTQDAEEHVADPGNSVSLTRIDFMHDSSVDELLDSSPQSTQVVDDIMEDSDIMEGSDDIEESNIVEGHDKKQAVLRTKASWDRLSRVKDKDVRLLVKSTPE
ncbi:uncharacterized protein F5147DRAFT_660104 [Suillus discolor]|uniref:Uncharacterized protein n=1 Tax=Suillus discolor TaxID=1912936 RepID=A0A9P7ERF4_9AGAM|nr:uncharacterized protein F5147DRAFT_660104 [Suillus discolor]KAG2083673.1 hypothetical protein F5147DRAFT_660104 [Suillus discolor]